MRGLFCARCKSLMPPGTDRCRVCGSALSDAESNQTCLFDGAGRSSAAERPAVVSTENPAAPYFPYEPRACQMDMVSDIRDALDSSRHIVLESGTGTGKTVVSLAAALEHAMPRGKRIVYLTRTISQSDQVMKELRSISSVRPVTGLTITGRGRSCPLLRGLSGYEDLPSRVLSSLCEDRKRKSMRGVAGGCRYFDRMKSEIQNIEERLKSFPTSDELDAYCESAGVCPYEVKKVLMKGADVVVAPYVHILSEDIRSTLLSNMGLEDESIVVIVDEAHNIIDAAREQESFTIHAKLLDNAVDECSALRDPPVCGDVKIGDFLRSCRSALKHLANSRLSITQRESRVSPGEFEGRVAESLSITGKDMGKAIDRIVMLGEERSDLLMEKGENRVSDIYSLGVLLRRWVSAPSDSYIRSVKADDDGELLAASCIDPSDITRFMRGLKGAVHMSGTLQPLEQYVRVMGLPKDTVTGVYPSPFPPGNRRVLYVNNVTTSYAEMKKDPSIFSRMEKNVARLCNAVDRNTLVFFPSYAMMAKMRPFLERDVRRTLYWEESWQPKRTMASLDRFRNGRGGVFFTVMGGSIAEGIDFPGDELCFAVIIGIPYPPPTLESKAMSDMFDARYGAWTGWRYVSEVPALRKMKQAVGRLIRTETDRGMAVILDSRMSKYAGQMGAVLSSDPAGEAAAFFEKEE